MTGGGFSGCTINIVRSEAVEELAEKIRNQYRSATQIDADVYVVNADDGAREERVSVPGADRGPRAGSPRGVVDATGSRLIARISIARIVTRSLPLSVLTA